MTFNVRHFPPAALDPSLVEAQHQTIFRLTFIGHPEMLVHVLHEQALGLRSLLTAQRQGMPRFVEAISNDLSIEL